MQRAIRQQASLAALTFSGVLALGPLSAPASEYRIVDGELADAGTCDRSRLSGRLELQALPVAASAPELRSFLVQDFALSAGELRLDPRTPVEFDGLSPLPPRAVEVAAPA